MNYAEGLSFKGFPGGAGGEEPRLPMQEMQETRAQSLGQKDLPEEETATHSGVLAWGVPWTEEPGRPQSTGLQS